MLDLGCRRRRVRDLPCAVRRMPTGSQVSRRRQPCRVGAVHPRLPSPMHQQMARIASGTKMSHLSKGLGVQRHERRRRRTTLGRHRGIVIPRWEFLLSTELFDFAKINPFCSVLPRSMCSDSFRSKRNSYRKTWVQGSFCGSLFSMRRRNSTVQVGRDDGLERTIWCRALGESHECDL